MGSQEREEWGRKEGKRKRRVKKKRKIGLNESVSAELRVSLSGKARVYGVSPYTKNIAISSAFLLVS